MKLANKIANLHSLVYAPPVEWSLKRKRAYVVWSDRVVAGLRGCNVKLERSFDAAAVEGIRQLGV